MAERKVAVVTGANKGIGYATVKDLCKKFDGDVYLTARDGIRGQEAVQKLKGLGYNPIFFQLDIDDQKSVDAFRDHLKKEHGGLDILINNAAIAFQDNETNPGMAIEARETIRINYYGTIRVCEALFPLLRQDGRVVNVSSSFGHSSRIKNAETRAKFFDKNITFDSLNGLINKFVRDAEEGKNIDELWNIDSAVAYSVSKVGISCLSILQQKMFDAETPNRNISVNAVHPGYIETDMTSEMVKQFEGAQPTEEGAKPLVYLALEANLKGKYVWKDGRVIEWDAPATPYYY